jgi:polysaccharide export outer membrane protein
MRAFYFTCIVGLVFIASSCSYRQNQVLFEKKNATADTITLQKTEVVSSYRIKPQDVLQIRNLQSTKFIASDPTKSTDNGSGSDTQGGTFQVEEDGIVALPVIGHIQVAGLTRNEATKLIEDLYRKKLLKDPIIELKVINLKVTLMGEIRSPGNYPLLKDNTTLIEVIGEAGGLTTGANEKSVKIIRNGKQVTVIDLSNITSISDPNAILQSGDVVYISQNKRAIRNDNLQNLSSIVQPALLLFNTALIIYTLSK